MLAHTWETRMSNECHYEIEQRMHDALAARDKRIEELLVRAIRAEAEASKLRDIINSSSPTRSLNDGRSTYEGYNEPTYGDY